MTVSYIKTFPDHTTFKMKHPKTSKKPNKKPQKTIRKSKTKRQSSRALAAKLGVSRSTLYDWKAKGAPMDRGSDAILSWALENVKRGHEAPEIQELKADVLRETARRLRLANDEKAGQTLDKLQAGLAITKSVTTFWNQIARLCETELPGELPGMTAPEIQAYLSAVSKRLKTDLRDGLEAALIPQGKPTNTPTK